MKGNCLVCLLRHIGLFMFFTNNFLILTCQHSREHVLKNGQSLFSDGKKYSIIVMQISIFCFTVYDLVINVTTKPFKSIVFILFGVDFFIECVIITLLIIHNLKSNTKTIKEIEKLVHICEAVKRFDRFEPHFKKFYWIFYSVFVIHIIVYFGIEVFFISIIVHHGINTRSTLTIITRIFTGKCNIPINHFRCKNRYTSSATRSGLID